MLTWTNAPVGAHVLTAVGTDNQGATTMSGPVAITVQLVKESDKWVSKSTCVVSPRTGTTTYKCNTPTVNESDDYRQAVVNITDF